MSLALECTPAFLMGWEDEEIKKKAEKDARIFQYTHMIDPDSELGKFIELNIDKKLDTKMNEQYKRLFEYAKKINSLTENQKNIIFGMVDEMSNKKEGKE